jgi:type IV pilus assembly protein PilW
MAKLQTRYPAPRRSRGMSLIEILVGVVIGLLGILVIFQVLAVSEDRKRTTVHGSDAQSAGAIALYQLQREVQLGGYGFAGAHTKQVGCLVRAHDALRTGAAGYPKDFTFRLYPVEIVQGAAGAPDTVRVLWGSSDQFITSRAWTTSGANKAMSGGRGGLDYGDLVVVTGDPAATAAGSTDCALVEVSARPAAQPSDIGHSSGTYTIPGPPSVTKTARFNKDATWPTTAPFTPTAGFALNLGKEPRLMEWRVTLPAEANPNRLLATNILVGNTITSPVGPSPISWEVADAIVNLQAEYGIDRNNNQTIDANEWTVTAPNNALVPTDLVNPCSDNPSRSWRCVRAIRVALLARSAHWDKSACTANPQHTSGATGALALTNFTMTNVDGSAPSAAELACTEDPPSANNWRRYRYSVYETVVPLRNMIWGTAP